MEFLVENSVISQILDNSQSAHTCVYMSLTGGDSVTRPYRGENSVGLVRPINRGCYKGQPTSGKAEGPGCRRLHLVM